MKSILIFSAIYCLVVPPSIAEPATWSFGDGNARAPNKSPRFLEEGDFLPLSDEGRSGLTLMNITGPPGGDVSEQESTFKPDNSPEMQIAWDEWHRRVGAAVFQRFQAMATAAFPRSRPMAAVAAYTVTRDGQIVNAILQEKAPNPIYNAIVLTAIQQLNGNVNLLKFPAGSSRTSMKQIGTFIHNNGSAPVGDFPLLFDARPSFHRKEYAR